MNIIRVEVMTTVSRIVLSVSETEVPLKQVNVFPTS